MTMDQVYLQVILRNCLILFRRGQKESKIAGVGLGLAICRSIARAHNADLLALQSTMGGASFILMLPYVEPPAMDDEESILAQLEE